MNVTCAADTDMVTCPKNIAFVTIINNDRSMQISSNIENFQLLSWYRYRNLDTVGPVGLPRYSATLRSAFSPINI